MVNYLKFFEKLAVGVLIFFLSMVVLISIGELGWLIWEDVTSPPFPWLQIDDLLSLFGFFLMILIGMELIESMRAYLIDGTVHSEVVLTVAIIALSRKVIILDAAEYDGTSLIGIGFIFVGLAVAYYIIKKTSHLT